MTDSTTTNNKPLDLSPSQVRAQMQRDDTVLIDVREPFEHRAERIDGAVLMPLGSLDVDALREHYQDKRVIFHCAAGGRSARACKQFAQNQSETTQHLAGGIEAWKQAGLPTVKPAKAGPISVMRQVQITAGSLVLIGLLLGWFASPWLLLLAAFVGCGLVFAGITGWCGMAKLLAKMPWNQSA